MNDILDTHTNIFTSWGFLFTQITKNNKKTNISLTSSHAESFAFVHPGFQGFLSPLQYNRDDWNFICDFQSTEYLKKEIQQQHANNNYSRQAVFF